MARCRTMTTLKDIARHLNLSVTQVSRALNGHSDVSKATQQRVSDAARALNYHPNVSARKLVAGRSGIVGLVATRPPLPDHAVHFVETIAGLSQRFAEQGMQFILHVIAPGDDPVQAHQRLIQGGAIDGFVITSPLIDDPRIAYLRDNDVPFVVHGRILGKADYAFFDIDNRQLSDDSTQLLLDQGHRRIALVNAFDAPPVGEAFAHARTQGYLDALRRAGVTPDEALILRGRMTPGFGLAAVARLWSGEAPPPTAIVCSSIMIAAGVYEGLGRRGIRIPEQVSIISHDDALPGQDSAAFSPPLTVTWAPLSDSWQPLASLLAARLNGAEIESLQRMSPHRMILRGSVSKRK